MFKTENLSTEKRNANTENLDSMTTEEFCIVMNREDHTVAEAVREALPMIVQTIDAAVLSIKAGGRLIYAGAGTSGRMGVMDAAECVPTFGVSPELVVALMAGGGGALNRAIEGAEDSRELALEDLQRIQLCEKDILVGIAASGRTPYVIAALDYAAEIGALPVALSCNKNSEISKHAKIAIEVDAGPEVLSGSTRLKAGTAQKLILNMISTGTMIQCGKVYKNLMVDVMMTNEKLKERGLRIVMQATGADTETAIACLKASGDRVKIAIVMILAQCDAAEAVRRLDEADGFINKAI
jgi:N-acetylmuramic acid 6-phosphate etherase